MLTQDEQMNLYDHNKHFQTDLPTNFQNRLYLRNLRPMRFAQNLDCKRYTLDNTFNDKKDIQNLNITKLYNNFKPDNTYDNKSRINTKRTQESVKTN